jgi:excinuclease UvrABC nuclease subunit
VKNLKKTYKNTKKSRNQLPKSPGAYNLKNRQGKTFYTGMTKDLNRRVKEHHYDKSKHFDRVTITPTKTKTQANKIENSRLSNKKPATNKKKK